MLVYQRVMTLLRFGDRFSPWDASWRSPLEITLGMWVQYHTLMMEGQLFCNTETGCIKHQDHWRPDAFELYFPLVTVGLNTSDVWGN